MTKTISNSDLLFLRAEREDRDVRYGDEASFEFWVKNRSQVPIEIHGMSVRLEPDLGIPTEHSSLSTHRSGLRVRIAPGGREPAGLRLTLPLLCRQDSNRLSVSVDYRRWSAIRLGRVRRAIQSEFDYLIVRSCTTTGETVFVSFADPEDLPKAEQAAIYLRRCGFRPYVATSDARPGCAFWREKIEPVIRTSSGVLVIWTGSTAGRPENVLREMEIARAASVEVGLFLFDGLEAPACYSSHENEYHRLGADWRHDLAHGILAASRQWRACSRMF